MTVAQTAQILIYTHAAFGGIALLMGAIALTVTKGSPTHKKAGKVFFYAMLTAAALALIIAVLPGHESPFLFSIGIFSSYFLVSGFRALRFKKPNLDLKIDKWISCSIIITGLVMMLYPIVLSGKVNIVLLVFGAFGFVFGIRDLIFLKDVEKVKADWQKAHLGKMTGGYIASVTAFFVVNNFLPGIYNWFIPGLVGGIYIYYWLNKLKSPAR